MAADPEALKRLIQSSIPDSTVEIRDLRGDGNHYAIYVESSSFKGKTRIEQHRMVHEALGNVVEKNFQALAIQTAEK